LVRYVHVAVTKNAFPKRRPHHTLCIHVGLWGSMMIRVLAALAALLLPLAASAQEKVLRAVMHADVRVIDPVWTTQTIANIHGALIYDTLFGNDGDQKPQPQMVGKYEISPTG
jgi:hypothetical protein